MNFSCGKCGRAYFVADERVRGRTFKVKCRSCDHLIVIKPGAEAAAAPSSPPEPELELAPPAAVSRPDEPSRPPPPPVESAPAQAADERSWFHSEPTEPAGPGEGGRAPAADFEITDGNGVPTGPPPPLPVLAAAPEESLPELPLYGSPQEKQGNGFPRPSRVPVVLAACGLLALVGAGAVYIHFRLLPVAPPAHRLPVAAVPAAPPQTGPAGTARSPAPPAPAAAPVPTPELTPEPIARPAEPARLVKKAPNSLPALRVRPGAPPAFEPESQRGDGRDGARLRRIASKDKKLLDLMGKKEDSAPAEPVEHLELDTAAPALDEGQVSRIVSENRKAFDACVSRAFRHEPGLQLRGRKVIASFTIRPDGTAVNPSLDDAEIDRSELGACLKATYRRLAFPAFEGDPIRVDVPLVLVRSY